MLMQLNDEGEPSFNLRLIEAVKHSRCLYDSTDRQYRSTEYKLKVWNRLVQLLHFDGDSRGLYNRWKQLRDKYGKEKRKQKFTGEMSTWQYFKHLVFLDPHMTDRQIPKCQTITTKDGKQQVIAEMQYLVTDPAFNSGLIEEVKQHTCLFDIRDPKYRHTECRNMSWNEIIKNLNFPGDINAIYKQWKKIRDRYVREKKRLRTLPPGVHEESTWDLYGRMTWMDPYLEDRATYFSHSKRKRPEMDDMSEDGMMFDDMGRPHSSVGYMMLEKNGRTTAAPQGDVLLDGDSAFAASAVSDLRSLPEHTRQLAKAQIESLLETGRMPLHIVHFDMK